MRFGSSQDRKTEKTIAATLETAIPSKVALYEKLARRPSPAGMIVFGLIIAAGMFYVARHLSSDLSVEKATSIRPFIMLAVTYRFGLRIR